MFFSWWLIHVEAGNYGRVKLDGLSMGIFLEVPGPLAEKVSKQGGVGGPVALASGYENTYPLPNRPE